MCMYAILCTPMKQHYQSHHWALACQIFKPFLQASSSWFLKRRKLRSSSCVWAHVCERLFPTSGPSPVPDQDIAAPGMQLPPALQNQVAGSERKTCKEGLGPPSRELPWKRCSRERFTVPPYAAGHIYIMLWWSVPCLSPAHHHPNCIQKTFF